MRFAGLLLLAVLSACASERAVYRKCDGCKVEVVVFIGPDCPVTQKYIPRLNEIARSYGDSVSLSGYIPQKVSKSEVLSFQKEYAVGFPLYADEEKRVANHFAATITPEAFVVAQGKVIYRGAIDNWFFSLGKYRSETTVHYLKDAIAAALKDKAPDVSMTEAIGCFIEPKR